MRTLLLMLRVGAEAGEAGVKIRPSTKIVPDRLGEEAIAVSASSMVANDEGDATPLTKYVSPSITGMSRSAGGVGKHTSTGTGG